MTCDVPPRGMSNRLIAAGQQASQTNCPAIFFCYQELTSCTQGVVCGGNSRSEVARYEAVLKPTCIIIVSATIVATK